MMKKLLLSICIALLIQSFLFAQQSDSTVTSTENSDTTEVSFWDRHNVNFAAIPMVNYDPAFQWNFVHELSNHFRS